MRALALVVALLFLPSCQALQDVLAQLDKPTASLAGVQFRDLDLESLTLDFDVAVDNPYDFDLPLTGLGYGLKSGGASILEGALEPSGSVPALGSTNLTVPAKIRFDDVLSLLSSIKPGSVIPYEAAFDVQLDVPGAQGYSIPLGTTGELPIPTVPEVELGGVRWSELSLDQATANLDLSILNTNDFGFDLENLLYELKLADRQGRFGRGQAGDVVRGRRAGGARDPDLVLPQGARPRRVQPPHR